MPTRDDQQIERKFYPLAVKAVDVDRSEFTGYSAGIGNRDLGDDVIEPGSFKKTIRERVGARSVKWLDNHNQHSTRDVWGTVVEAAEVPVGDIEEDARPVVATTPPEDGGPTHVLLTRFEVSRADEAAQVALRKIAERHLNQLSIGYRALKYGFEADEGADENMEARTAWLMGQGVRKIQEIQWWETSVVIWAMNPEAQILNNSVDQLIQWTRKAAATGMRVPGGKIRETMEALKALSDCELDDDRTACVRRAVTGVESALKDLREAKAPRQADPLDALLEEFKARHGDVTRDGFSLWVTEAVADRLDVDAKSADNEDIVLPDAEPVEEPDATEDEETKDGDAPDEPAADPDDAPEDPVAEDTKDEDTPVGDDDEADDDAPEDPADGGSKDGGDAGDDRDPVERLAATVEKLLAEVHGAGSPEDESEDEKSDDDAPEGDHVEAGAAKDADPGDAPEDGRAEHSRDEDDALALELEELELMALEAGI